MCGNVRKRGAPEPHTRRGGVLVGWWSSVGVVGRGVVVIVVVVVLMVAVVLIHCLVIYTGILHFSLEIIELQA